MVSLPEEENTPEKRVNKIFDLMDKVISEQWTIFIIDSFFIQANPGQKRKFSETEPFESSKIPKFDGGEML